MDNYDITIIGDGVAAASALLSLHQCKTQIPNLKVAFVAPIKKIKEQQLVGESLPPSIKPLLQQLELWQPFKQANFPIARNRFTAWENNVLQPSFAPQKMEGFGWCIDRPHFEQLLWQQVSTTAFEHIEQQFISSQWQQDNWQITLADKSKLNSQFILDCTGRAASFAKHYSHREKCQPMVAICDFLPPMSNTVERTPGVLIEAVESGWWYSTLLPNGYLAIAYFTLRDLLDRKLSKEQHHWFTLLNNSFYTSQRVNSGEFQSFAQPKVHDTSTSLLKPDRHQKHWLACGDAAIALDPLSAHGISTALWSGRKAAQAAVASLLHDNYPLEQYVESCTSNWQIYKQQRANLYSAQQRFSNSQFWQDMKKEFN